MHNMRLVPIAGIDKFFITKTKPYPVIILIIGVISDIIRKKSHSRFYFLRRLAVENGRSWLELGLTELEGLEGGVIRCGCEG